MGNTRYIWEKYNIIATENPYLDWEPEVTRYSVAFSGNLGDSDNPLLWAEPNFHNGEYYDISLGNTDVIRCFTDMESDAAKTPVVVRAVVYYGITEPNDSEPFVTYESHPYVISDAAALEYAFDVIHIISVNTAPDTDGNPCIGITFRGTKSVMDYDYSMGNDLIGYVTSSSKTVWPEDGVTADRDCWYHYITSDTLKISMSDISLSHDMLSKRGTVVSARFIEPVGNLGESFSYDWSYSIDNAETWIRSTTGTTSTTNMFQVYPDTTGFAVGIIIHDGFGYTSDRCVSKTIYVVDNIPPSSPTFKTIPTSIVAGTQFDIEWNPSTDDDGSVYGYVLERSIDGSDSWTLVMSGIDTHAYDKIESASNVQYRVKAFDNELVYSDQTESNIIPVIINKPPTISGENENLGCISSFVQSYTVSDKGDKVTVSEYFDNTLLPGSPYTVVEGVPHSISFTGETWDEKIENGIHVVKVVAIDSYGAQAVRSWIFRKGTAGVSDQNVDRIKMFRKMKDGSYRPARFENDSTNISRPEIDLNVEESLSLYLPELRKTDDIPYDINYGKIVVGYENIFAKTDSGKIIMLQPLKPPYIASNTAPNDKTLFWIDTSDQGNPLLRYWNGTRWQLIKSIYSGGTRDY